MKFYNPNLTSVDAFCDWLSEVILGGVLVAPEASLASIPNYTPFAAYELLIALESESGTPFPVQLIDVLDTPADWHAYALVKRGHLRDGSLR